MSTTMLLRRFGIAMLSLVLIPSLHANPCRNPKRAVDATVVDLNPLFRWWTNHVGVRPLTAWVHVSGKVIATNAWGWTIKTATLEDSGRSEKPTNSAGSFIILKHPPKADQAQFLSLSARLNSLNQQRAAVGAAEASAKKHAKNTPRIVNNNRRGRNRINRNQAQERNDARQAEAADRNLLQALDQQIQQVKTQLAGYPSTDHYVLDCLALETTETVKGLRVYDYGKIWK